MKKRELDYILEALNYGLKDCVDLNDDTGTHYNIFANAIEIVQQAHHVSKSDCVCTCGSENYGYGWAKCYDCGKVKDL